MNRIFIHGIPSAFLFCVLLLLSINLSGCSQSTPSTVATSPSVAQSAIPEDTSVVTTSYPPPLATQIVQSAYPSPGSENNFDIPAVRFALDTPIQAGVTQITGNGPKEVYLDVVDISDTPEILGSGVIGQDNRFLITLSAPLKPNQIIAIQYSFPSSSAIWSTLWELRSENGKTIPGKGDFFDIVTVSSGD